MALSPTAVKKYQATQEDIAILMCKDILEKPQEFYSLIRLAAGRIVMTITYGLPLPLGSKYLDLAKTAFAICSPALVPGAYLADTLPILKHLPSWMPFHKDAQRGRNAMEAAFDQPYNHFMDELRRGVARPSLANDVTNGDSELSDDLAERVKWVLGTMYVGGSETTHGTTMVFMWAMALHPNKQRIAQAEIDRLLDTENRVPVISDLPRLPYLNAVIKETMRWQPILPLSLARRTAEASEYDGYTMSFPTSGPLPMPRMTDMIPMILSQSDFFRRMANLLRILHHTHLDLENEYAPGKTLAEGSLVIFFASILATFNLSLPEETLESPPVFQSGRRTIDTHLVNCRNEIIIIFPLRLRYPEPFKWNIIPRSAAHIEQMKRRGEQCQF